MLCCSHPQHMHPEVSDKGEQVTHPLEGNVRGRFDVHTPTTRQPVVLLVDIDPRKRSRGAVLHTQQTAHGNTGT